MSDIVERARSYVHNLGGPPEDYLMWQLADRIEQLEAALKQIVAYNGFDRFVITIARRALEDKK